MGHAAYLRGSDSIARGIREDYDREHPVEFEVMDRLNSLDKYPDAGSVTFDVDISMSHGVWWILPAGKHDSYGFWYPSLRELIMRWNITVTGYNDGDWFAVPQPTNCNRITVAACETRR